MFCFQKENCDFKKIKAVFQRCRGTVALATLTCERVPVFTALPAALSTVLPLRQYSHWFPQTGRYHQGMGHSDGVLCPQEASPPHLTGRYRPPTALTLPTRPPKQPQHPNSLSKQPQTSRQQPYLRPGRLNVWLLLLPLMVEKVWPPPDQARSGQDSLKGRGNQTLTGTKQLSFWASRILITDLGCLSLHNHMSPFLRAAVSTEQNPD